MEKLKRTCISDECMSKECPAFKRKLEARINRIEGQIRGIGKMLGNKVGCDDVLNQISSVKSALNGVSKLILESHIRNCVVNDIKAGRYVEGGSTITQQLAKNLYFSQEKTMNRKAAEAFLALELERNYTKDEILELYVNSIYFGDGYYNVGEASEGYFGKPAAKMNDYECTLLAGVPNAPSKYAPSKNLALAEKRQKKVISRMEACGYLTKEDTTLMSAELVAMN